MSLGHCAAEYLTPESHAAVVDTLWQSRKPSISQNNCGAWDFCHPPILQVPPWCARAALQDPNFSENAEQRVQMACCPKVDELTFYEWVLWKKPTNRVISDPQIKLSFCGIPDNCSDFMRSSAYMYKHTHRHQPLCVGICVYVHMYTQLLRTSIHSYAIDRYNIYM